MNDYSSSVFYASNAKSKAIYQIDLFVSTLLNFCLVNRISEDKAVTYGQGYNYLFPWSVHEFFFIILLTISIVASIHAIIWLSAYQITALRLTAQPSAPSQSPDASQAAKPLTSANTTVKSWTCDVCGKVNPGSQTMCECGVKRT